MTGSLRSAPALLLALALLLPQTVQGASTPAPIGAGGAVSSGDPLATKAGIEILRSGGNAVDAAVATALALAVVYPEAGNLGGGGFAMVKKGDKVSTLDFREMAPAAARRDMYLNPKGDPVENASLVGPLAAGVPGSPAGLFELHRKMGKLPWKRVVEPARKLAAEGFRVDRHLNELLDTETSRKLFEPFPETKKVWLPGGKPPALGTVLRLPELAATLARYAEHGPEGISTGPVAAALEAASRKYGGVLTAADLAAYKPVWREPVVVDAYGWKIASMPLPSSGGIILGQTVGMLERLDWAKLPRFGAERAHLLTEVFRRAYADRFLLGDPSTTRADRGAAPRPGLAGAAGERHPPAPRHAVQGDRTLAGLGRRGRGGGSGRRDHAPLGGGRGRHDRGPHHHAQRPLRLRPVRPRGRLLPQQRDGRLLDRAGPAQPLWPDPGGGQRRRTRQADALVHDPDDRLEGSLKEEEAIALGGRGGSRIPTNSIQVLLNMIADGDGLQAALDRPRLHHQWFPDQLEAEPDAFSPETRAELEKRGHHVYISNATAKVHAVAVRSDGRFEAASDPRGTGLGAVVRPER